jgi:hypothetical protein
LLHIQPLHWTPGALTADQCATGQVAATRVEPKATPSTEPVSAARRWAAAAHLADSFPITRTALLRPNANVRVVSFLQLNELVGQVTFERTDPVHWQVTTATACALPTPPPTPHLDTVGEATAWFRERFPWVISVTQAPRPVSGHLFFEVTAADPGQRQQLREAIDRYGLGDVVTVPGVD